MVLELEGLWVELQAIYQLNFTMDYNLTFMQFSDL
jgi:hypothetical protein